MKKKATEFRRETASVEDYDRSGRPKDDTTDENVEFVQSDHVWQEKKPA